MNEKQKKMVTWLINITIIVLNSVLSFIKVDEVQTAFNVCKGVIYG